MTDSASPTPSTGSLDPAARAALATELDVTEEQIDEAVAAVGPVRGDIEMHLKGSRSTTNADKVRAAGG
jgi:hypothetical protein